VGYVCRLIAGWYLIILLIIDWAPLKLGRAIKGGKKKKKPRKSKKIESFF
jgi:hypothetical protein